MKRYQVIQRTIIESSVIDSMFHVMALSFASAVQAAYEEAKEINDQPNILSICECDDKNVTPSKMKTRLVKLKKA